MAERFWSDDFDMDLPNLVPLDEILGDTANVRLWTHGNTSHGRLNHPAVWPVRNGLGMEAFFGLSPENTGKPDWYSCDWPVVECTWREAVRDAWPHTYIVVVGGREVWNTCRLHSTFVKLMFDLRGWSRLPDGEADKLRGVVRANLTAATRTFAGIVAQPREVSA